MSNTKKALRYFAKYLKPYWKGITIVVILSLISSGAQVMAPTYLGRSVTALTTYLVDLKKGTASMNTFYSALWSMFLFYLLSQIAIFIAWMVMSKFNADSTNDMRENLFAKFQRMLVRYFDTHQDGKLLSLFTSDLDNIFNAMNNAIFEIISQGIMFVGTIIVMFTINSTLAWTTIATTPFILIVSVLLMKKARVYIDKQQDEIGDLNGYITEQINGEKVIITNGLRQESVDGFKVYNNKVRTALFKGQFYSGILFPLMNGLNLLNLAIVIAMGSWMIISGQVSQAIGLGLIVTFVEYSQVYFQPLTQITSIYSMIQLALTGARRLATVEEQKDENEVPNGKVISGLNHGVKLENVHFGYNKDKEILHGVNISVDKGQSVALVGPTGSGKTTIMNLLNRFYDVNSGKVTFDGTDVRDIQLTSLRNNVGIVLQDSVLFTGTVADNIRYGKPNASMDEVISAAKQANIHDFIETLPDGYDTQVSDASSIFSTGQKQLMSIARTILTNPPFLILDEATSNVDTVTEEKIQKAMDTVIAGRTSFVIAHRLKTILNSNKIVVLKDGNVIEEGSHEALLKEKGFYYKLYTDQMAFD
ncbi:MAG: ABC transporter ATP-binding protein/permease [Lactobacillus crispatus]|jgi:ATP-binding cassette subfamily B multidrug efflux pump|uniref:ABC transporter ATP-binding protein n=1 Tax=Lactobacillus crispatus TaxID=47770 RepID=UPI0018AACD40|nr:ABC transporter ATP-binding protein [Lactobacillus crispatus]MCH4005227.1 ABC transporter ATP-binding protein/permease [Lactobacillus crispatus]MCI1335053.1 ABC transporter ATP-binding protein/permease [Lactobacillus crispatus]MCI1364473.1 ABC transporter ATP-binding protein/permease [Lactobacillus crispatus]MCI1492944.1 ABC transporter ATP-binding protein/permease [Lactobacillus crispatus]MCI1523539.1 ABC transporter ATP-binding protein/permease [Lactobacillus crispatus]